MDKLVTSLWWYLHANKMAEAKLVAIRIRKKLSKIQGIRLYHYDGFADYGITLVGNTLTVDYNEGYGKFYKTFEFEEN